MSYDANSNMYNYRFIFFVEIVLVCKEDLVVIFFKFLKEFGSVGLVMLCTRVLNFL